MPAPTRALWCDFGKHSFSENDEWKSVTMSGKWGKGKPAITVDVTWTACMNHIPGVPKELIPLPSL